MVAVKSFQLIPKPQSGSYPIIEQRGINLIEQGFTLDTQIDPYLMKPIDIFRPIGMTALSGRKTCNDA